MDTRTSCKVCSSSEPNNISEMRTEIAALAACHSHLNPMRINSKKLAQNSNQIKSKRKNAYDHRMSFEFEMKSRQDDGKRPNKRRRATDTRILASSIRQLSLFLVLASLLVVNQTLSAQGAVVRPTNFLGLSPEEAQVINSGQQQQQQQPQPTAQVTSSASQSPMALPDGQQQQAQQSTKISPLKSRFCTSLNGAKLDAPLGLQSMAIDDLALTASSHSNEQVGAQMARLNLDIQGGAWCPVKPISNSNFGKEWIQAKLNRSFVVTAIETQGRFGMGSGKEFVPSYQVEYSRNGGHTWHKWKDFRGSVMLRANEDVNSPVRNELSPPIVGANVIRILPFSQHLKTVCLRFELHGCPYDEGAPIAYATNDGVVEPRWGHLIDYTYDGHRLRGQLSHGLGQLVDGVKGPDNFSHNAGFEWVGWKSMNGDVVVEFSFKTVRNFTGALFHSNNLFSSGVEVFQSVDVHYGIDVPLSMDSLRDSLLEQRRRDALYRREAQTGAANGMEDLHQLASTHLQQQQHHTLWSNDVLSIEYEPDKKVESSRPVTVHLKQRLANKLRFVLKFASKWILVSEVEFLSHPVELLSLASVDQRSTPTLLGALSPAKTYDEFVAILREHQLRRIATNAFLESFGATPASSAPSSTSNSSTEPSSTSGEPSGDQPSPYDDFITSTNDPLAGRRVTGPAIPAATWQTSGPGQSSSSSSSSSSAPATYPGDASQASPSTNPLLNQVMSPFGPIQPNSGYPPDVSLAPSQETESFLMTGGNQMQNKDSSSSSSSMSEKRTLGLATVISFVLVSILVFVGLLFAISSYRLRHRPKLGIPHLSHHGAAAGKSMSPPSLQSFMSVFSSSNQQQHQQQQAQQQHLYQENNHFNAIFATGERRDRGAAAQTLRRLANTIGQSQQPKGGHLLFGAGNATTQPNQLFVSMKDSSNGKGPVSTQLILGLNQANPLAQQQVYSSCNGGQPTYSTSLSMASSSTTTGHQGDYGEYAIPDAQPIIPPLSGMASNNGHNQLAFSHQQHLNPAFSASPAGQGTFKQPQFSCHTELRSGHRPQHHQTLIQPQVLHQPQQQQQQQAMAMDHNYELIQQQDQPQRQAHNRALSGQMQPIAANCGQLSPAAFNSMTLGHGRGHLAHDSAAGIKARLPLSNECSPGAGSSASGATTATTSANSRSGGGDLARYYAYANE